MTGMAVARRSSTYLAWLWLSLTVILGHALLPVDSPLARRSGSAFSHATYEVALKSRQWNAVRTLAASAADEGDDRDGPPPTTALLPNAPDVAVAAAETNLSPAPLQGRIAGAIRLPIQPRAPPQA